MWRVLGNTLLNHDQRVKLKGEKADVCDVVPSTAAQFDLRQYILKLMNLFIVYCCFHIIVCWVFVLGPCFVVQDFVSFLVLQ